MTPKVENREVALSPMRRQAIAPSEPSFAELL